MKLPKSFYLAAAAAIAALTVLVTVHADAPATQPAPDAADPVALIGKAAPDFHLADLAGAAHSLAETKGHVTVLDFWGVWCVPCHIALPHVDELYKEQSSKGLMAFAIDNGDVKPTVQKFAADTKVSLPILLDSDSVAANAYNVSEYPQTVVIGKDGRVKNVFVGFKPDVTPAALEKAVTAAMNDSGNP